MRGGPIGVFSAPSGIRPDTCAMYFCLVIFVAKKVRSTGNPPTDSQFTAASSRFVASRMPRFFLERTTPPGVSM